MVAAEVGQSVATALQATMPAPAGLTSSTFGVTTGSNSKQMYNEYDIAILMGLSGATLLLGTYLGTVSGNQECDYPLAQHPKDHACMGNYAQRPHRKGTLLKQGIN